jgi:hypothetical protein
MFWCRPAARGFAAIATGPMFWCRPAARGFAAIATVTEGVIPQSSRVTS